MIAPRVPSGPSILSLPRSMHPESQVMLDLWTHHCETEQTSNLVVDATPTKNATSSHFGGLKILQDNSFEGVKK